MPTASTQKKSKTAPWIWGTTLTPWGLVALALIAGILQDGTIPVDASTYFDALEKYDNNVSPYASPETNQATWRAIHALEGQVLSGALDDLSKAQIPGPYIYPPTLLQLLGRLNVSPTAFMLWLLGSLILFSWLWLKVSQGSAWWLLLILFSWDVLASFTGGNVEIILLASTLASAYGLYHGRSLWAAPAIAFVVLVKPFYALFFVTFGLFMLATHPSQRSTRWRHLLASAAATLGLLAVAVWLWPDWIRPLVFDYLREGLAHTWYVLPLAEQSPMSIWNRTLMQGLVNLGISASLAQVASLLTWIGLTAWTFFQIRQRSLPFPLIFAFSFLLLYWFRPVGWGLIFLDLVVLTAVWPYALLHEKKWLLRGAILLAASHWAALFLTGALVWFRLFTLQSAAVPWETWLVFPVCWMVLWVGARRASTLDLSENRPTENRPAET